MSRNDEKVFFSAVKLLSTVSTLLEVEFESKDVKEIAENMNKKIKRVTYQAYGRYNEKLGDPSLRELYRAKKGVL